jgi:hypothetical protein
LKHEPNITIIVSINDVESASVSGGFPHNVVSDEEFQSFNEWEQYGKPILSATHE